uniref:Protein kinase domain-containing protein n=1 Tax=Caenorhabditis tropicalis TaxID=1561998 RepID=A0A1I7UNH7_9PELO
MKLLYLLVIFFAFILTTTKANSLPISALGPCQKRCITQFGKTEERITNIDTLYRQIEVLNNTDFSLCRLGCSHPEFSTLSLPEFLYGQLAYQSILSSSESFLRENVVKSVDVLCLDRSENSATEKSELIGKVVLVLEDGVDPLQNIYFVEVVTLDSDDDGSFFVFQGWCYSPYCNISFNVLPESEFRVRVSTFDDDGSVGSSVYSTWYNMQKILSSTTNSLKLKDIEWKDDEAAARFEIVKSTSHHVPTCSFQINHKTILSTDYTTEQFNLDHTHEIFLKHLDFNQNYTMSLTVDSDDTSEILHIAVPECSEIVDDLSMCAPPPVSMISSYWNTSTTHDSWLIIDWSYDYILDKSVDLTSNAVRTSHFHFSVHPLITPNNEKCEKFESIRRDVSFTYRKFIFNVPDAKCNYEVEVSVFDTKRRKSESKRIKVTRVNEPSFMALIPSSELQITIGLMALLISLLLAFLVIILFCLLKRKNSSKRLKGSKKGTVVYAYVDEASRNLIGVKPAESKFVVPVGSSNKGVEKALTQRVFNYTIHDGGSKGGVFQNAFTNQMQFPSESITPRPYGDFDAENPYEYILDHYVESELSDDVFEEDISFTTNPSIHQTDSPAASPMPPIAPFEDFDTLPAYAHRNFRFGKSYETPGNAFSRMKAAVDVSRGHCFTLKFSKDYSEPTRKALRKELEVLRTLPLHQNCVRFDGVVIGRWENIPYQITGILMEDCRGGSLHYYIDAVGLALRRQAMRTPDDPALPFTDGTPNLSSGYESFTSKGRQSPDGQSDSQRVSNAFCRFAENISAALEHLHRAGILHTRVSNVSVYLSFDYNDPLDEVLSSQVAKLGDFGSSSRSPNDVVIDTVLQPPEVINGKKYESKSDIWQFGVCLVEMSSLGVPYHVRKDVPPSGIPDFDLLPSTLALRNCAKLCLKLRSRPTASELRSIFLEKAANA